MPSSTASTPSCRCHKINRPFILSGALDDPIWQQASTLELYDIHGKPGRFKTQVRLLYDATFLYVGFTCEDTYVWGTITERNGAIYEQECVEVFLNPANARHQYYEINVSPLNTVFDACIINGRTPQTPQTPFYAFPSFDLKELHTAVKVLGEVNRPGAAKGWRAELAIPFAELPGAEHTPPQPGDVWRANFYRIDQPDRCEPEHYAWSRTDLVNFHLPWRFGCIKFD
ncbi:MAG: hypothetical protein BWY83_00555 [bacterium ADurb.Bin478]|nr:MAG: hypothetical protein BWY83_00555 [bacterium ADurb.Bin478]